MRLTRTAALAGLASLALAGAAWAAEKPVKPVVNVMEVALPGGGVARISYSGDVAPRILVGEAGADALRARYEAARFAEMDRFMAAMAERAALMRERMRLTMAALAAQARSGARDGDGMRWVSLPGFGAAAGVALPPGAVSYSSVTRVSGGRACTETVQVTRTSADAAPQVVRRTSGDCGAGAATPAAPRAVAPARRPRPAVRPDQVI
ncbi:MAG TPA: hypothetical protein VEC11_17150 [Allosphingosinicella sp.]|nr:hypothetical protein [Allosphingosinicella sp.]